MALLSILVPVFNECGTLETVLRRVWAAPLPPGIAREIIVVDDGSTDGTAAVLRTLAGQLPLRVLYLPRRRGKSAALKAALAQARGEWVAFQDADLEYDPAHLPRLLAPLLAGQAGVVCGSRFQGRLRRMAWLVRWANRCSTWTVNRLYGTQLTDVNTGYKVMRRALPAALTLSAKHFGIDAEILAKLLRQGHRVLEVPIDYVARRREEGKKMNWVGALGMFLCFFRYRWGRVA